MSYGIILIADTINEQKEIFPVYIDTIINDYLKEKYDGYSLTQVSRGVFVGTVDNLDVDELLHTFYWVEYEYEPNPILIIQNEDSFKIYRYEHTDDIEYYVDQ